MENSLKKTALYDVCLKAGGKMVDFHGWLLPVQYESIIAEHNAVRQAAGVFDVSHMGQVFFEGPDAYKFLQTVGTNNFKNIPAKGTYSHVVNEQGGVIDDVIAFCLAADKFLVVVNSATRFKDFEWFKLQAKNFNVKVTDSSDDYSMVALQGPKSLDILEALDKDIKSLPRFNIKSAKIFGADCYITRTGYTGEDGVEIMGPAQTVIKLFEWSVANGFKPCGLGARDVLRLEAGYLLSGSDMDESKTPFEASCGWVVKFNKAEDFIGKKALLAQKERGVEKKWTGFVLTGAGIAREGCKIFKDGKEIGVLTSATYSPLFKCICAGYAPADMKEGDEAEIEVRGRKIAAKAVKMPFYKNKV